MIRNIRSVNTLTIFYFLFIVIIFLYFIYKLINGYGKDSWQITEMLINYQGGFVRRGLLGEGLLGLYKNFGINPYYTIVITSVFFYLTLIVFFVRKYIRNGYPIYILPFAFFLGAPVINDFFIRKDIIVVLLFILIIYFADRKPRGYLFLINILLSIGLLIHEEIAFFCFPVLLLILVNSCREFEYRLIYKVLISTVKILPSIAVFFLCIYNSGSGEISQDIWDSWKHIPFPYQADDTINIPPAAIDGISWTTGKAFSYTVQVFKNFNDGLYAPLVWIIILIFLYFFLTNTDKLSLKILGYEARNKFDKNIISNVLILQFISIIPLFIIGWDYGRWVFLWVTSSFAIVLLIDGQKLSRLFPVIINRISSGINAFLSSTLNPSRAIIFVIPVLIGIPDHNWDMQKYMLANPVYIILKFFSNLIELLIL